MKLSSKVWQLLGLGWYIALCLVLGILGGVWLDQQLDRAPFFMLIGLILGMAASCVGLYRMVMDVLNEDESDGRGT